ncbi:MAG: acetylxylan esterase [Bryobacterales bacterium]|nr:acetylxylan esterase [Bryobacterales bacterium]
MHKIASFLILACTAAGQPTVDRHLSILAEESLRTRGETVSKLTRASAEKRREEIRARIVAEIGGYPTVKSPLNARITGTFARQGYRVENVIYESLPRFYVTANLYVPDGAGPFPALIGVAGHSANGKASATYQHVWISMAKRGYVVLAIDPPGQGERLETLDRATRVARAGIGTSEHTHNGMQLLLTGNHIARYESWDGVRAFDYLASRKEVDAKRIAVAGNSGGGTQAAYLSVLDPRLAAIVSSCYMTSWKDLWYKPGPQDAEQVFPDFLKDGFDFPDFAFAAAPRPFLMTTAIQDFFPIAGARRTRDEIKGFFRLFDAEAKAGYFEYDDTHGWSKPRREAAYRFLDQWLKGQSTDGAEPELTTEPEQLLYAAPQGQVLATMDGETTQTINAREALAMHRGRAATSRPVDRKMIETRLRMAPVTERFHDLALDMPSKTKPAAIIALNASKADTEAMKDAGFAVLRIQFPSSDPARAGYTSQYQTASRALLVGRTLLGLQVSDVLHAIADVAANQSLDASRIRLYGRGNAAVAALHAAALSPRVTSVAVEAMPLSYLAITQAKLQRGLVEIIVPGVLKDYDLPDLAAAIAPRPVYLVDTRDAAGIPLMEADVRAAYPKSQVQYRPEGWTFGKVYERWLR